MKTTQEMIAVMQAFENGAKIEFRGSGNKWIDTPNPLWDWASWDYRVKEELKKTEYIPFTFEDAELS